MCQHCDDQRKLSPEEIERKVYEGDWCLNRARRELGLPKFEFHDASQPFLNTPTGPAYLDPNLVPPATGK